MCTVTRRYNTCTHPQHHVYCDKTLQHLYTIISDKTLQHLLTLQHLYTIISLVYSHSARQNGCGRGGESTGACTRGACTTVYCYTSPQCSRTRRLLPQVWVVATHCNALQHTAKQCNAAQRSATRCNIVQRAMGDWSLAKEPYKKRRYSAEETYNFKEPGTLDSEELGLCFRRCVLLQHTATRCNTLQHTATQCCADVCCCNTLQHTATRCNKLQHAATHDRRQATDYRLIPHH